MISRVCIFLFLVFISQPVFSQKFAEADASKTFEGFEFGVSPESFGNQVDLYLTISLGISYYQYHGRLLRSKYDLKSHSVNLGFENDKLNYLDIYFKNLSAEEYQYLLEHLEEEYGASESITALDTGVIDAAEWKGNSITMQLFRYNEEAIDQDDRNMTVLAVSLNQ